MFEVLSYLYESYMQLSHASIKASNDLGDELKSVGFKASQIIPAFSWLNLLKSIQEDAPIFETTDKHCFRPFAEYELRKLRPDCLAFIYHLEQGDILTPHTREVLLECALAIDHITLDLEKFKLLSLIVLSYLDTSVENLAWLESSIFYEQTTSPLH